MNRFILLFKLNPNNVYLLKNEQKFQNQMVYLH